MNLFELIIHTPKRGMRRVLVLRDAYDVTVLGCVVFLVTIGIWVVTR